MNPADGWGIYCLMKYKDLSQPGGGGFPVMSAPNSGKKSFSPHIIPETKGLEKSLPFTSPTSIF